MAKSNLNTQSSGGDSAPEGSNSKFNMAQFARSGVGFVFLAGYLATLGCAHAAMAKPASLHDVPPDDDTPTMPTPSSGTGGVAESDDAGDGEPPFPPLVPEGVTFRPELFVEFQDMPTERIEAETNEGILAVTLMKKMYPVGQKITSGAELSPEDRNIYNELADYYNLSSDIYEVLDKETLSPDDYTFLLQQYKILLQLIQNDVVRHIDILAYLNHRYQFATNRAAAARSVRKNNEGMSAFMA
ncbi:hypothetical protein KJ742_06680, partial [Patescibacteria group bacterium]|nr:hypothetical protein [Patescibacteria group bacterium]